MSNPASAGSTPIISIEHLVKTFESKNGPIQALQDINLEIYPGEIFGIIGMSGAGKSTLVRCINLLEKPTSGKITFDGQDLISLNQSQLNQARKSMGMIFQQFNLLMQKNALANVLFPLEISGVPKEEALQKAKELLKMVDLEDRMFSYPKQLSGGQKQRVAIARALATNPKVLLCDEATSALDPKTTRSILGLLKEINRNLGITIIVITHEMKVIEEICTRVAIIDESKIAEIGDVKDIFTHPKSMAAKKLVYPEGEAVPENFGESDRYLRIIFDGRSSYEPVLANMILDCHETVNIFYANSRNIKGNAVGEIVVQLPNDEYRAEKIKNYLENKGITIEVFRNFNSKEGN